jgi:serine/threonine-protein kinase RsbW
MAVVPELKAGLDDALVGGCSNVVLDLTDVTYADSSALGLLVWLDHRLRPTDGRLVLAGANRDVSRILELSGLINVAVSIGMSASVTAALEGLDLGPTSTEALWRRGLSVPPDANRLAGVRDEVIEILAPLGFPESAQFDIKVALGEALANAVRHGAPVAGSGDVDVQVIAYEDRVVLEVADNGVGFDGIAPGAADVYAPSGRGIMFMRALMDDVEFVQRPSGGTLVRLVKHRVGEVG